MSITGKGFKKLIKVSEALRKIEAELRYRITEAEVVDLISSINRVAAENIVAPADIPPFNRAAMDGYAVRAEDISGATTTNPVLLKVIGKIEVGELSDVVVSEGDAVEISTGAPIPKGANAVVPYEETNRIGEYIEVYKAIPPWKNISKRGEDIKRGSIVISKGSTIRAWNIGVLASLNIVKVKVYRKPKIAVLSTGNEIVELGCKIEEGKIVDSTKWMLRALIESLNCEFINLGISSDNKGEIAEKVLKGIKLADMIITTGGTSVGKRDYTVEAVMEAGGNLIFHGVSMRPGKPTAFAILNEKPILMLSGFPVAALMGFEVFGRKIISLISGLKAQPKPKVKAKISRRVASIIGVRDYLRVKLKVVNGELWAEPLKLTGSGILSTITEASGIVVIPEEVEGFDVGDEVEVILLEPIEELNL